MALAAINSKTVDGTMTVIFPTPEAIEHGLEYATSQRERMPRNDDSSRIQLERKVKQLKEIKSRRKKTGKGCLAVDSQETFYDDDMSEILDEFD